MRKRRSTYHVHRPTDTCALADGLADVLARSCEVYRAIDVHGVAIAPLAIELLLSAPSRPQLAGFLQHLFRTLSIASGGGIYVGRVISTRLSTAGGVAARVAEMAPYLARDCAITPLPPRLGGPPPTRDLFEQAAC